MNVDDPYAHVMMDAVDQKVADLHTYSMSDKTADLYAFDSRFTGKSSAFKVTYEGKTYQFETRLAGRFNIYNTLGAIGAALSEGIPWNHCSCYEDIPQCAGAFRADR